MEAMAARLPVIATTVGGQREMLLDGVNALTFEPGDAEGLATQILCLLHRKELREQIATAGQETVLEHFTLGRMVDEMEEWLTELCR
jgi:glycosyltransferase involved in cell wall biosynthesis